jgi:hypothetical protein
MLSSSLNINDDDVIYFFVFQFIVMLSILLHRIGPSLLGTCAFCIAIYIQ